MCYIVQSMKTVVVMSLKGGTGKSTCTAQIGLSLKAFNYRIGFLDLDIHGPNLPLSLGLPKPPPLEVDTEKEVVLPAKVNGYELMSMASHFGEGSRILWRGEDKLDLARQLLTGVIGWGELDYLVIDSPPSQGEEVMGIFDYLPDIYGVVIVSQPTDFSKADNDRALDLLRVRKIPIIGMLSNMDGCICPQCGNRFYPFLTKRFNVEEYAASYKIPFLGAIPQVPSIDIVKPLFEEIARKVDTLTPIKLPTHEKRREFKREALKIFLEEERD